MDESLHDESSMTDKNHSNGLKIIKDSWFNFNLVSFDVELKIRAFLKLGDEITK